MDYDPYGSILREFVNGRQEKYLTTHHERDVETGLDYRGARYYDSDVARFLSLDPLAADYASWSAYNYVMGNPVSLVDPDGRSCGCPVPPCAMAVQRLESMWNLAVGTIVEVKSEVVTSVSNGLDNLGAAVIKLQDFVVGKDSGGQTLTTNSVEPPVHNKAVRQGEPAGHIDAGMLEAYFKYTKSGPERFGSILPDPGPQTYTEGVNKLYDIKDVVAKYSIYENKYTPFYGDYVDRKDTIGHTSDTLGGRLFDGRVVGEPIR